LKRMIISVHGMLTIYIRTLIDESDHNFSVREKKMYISNTLSSSEHIHPKIVLY
jgi:hypothetical protein